METTEAEVSAGAHDVFFSNREMVRETAVLLPVIFAAVDGLLLLVVLITRDILDTEIVLELLLVFPTLPMILCCLLPFAVLEYRVTGDGIEYKRGMRKTRFLAWRDIKRIRLRPSWLLVGNRETIPIRSVPSWHGALHEWVVFYLAKDFDWAVVSPQINFPSKPAYLIVTCVAATMGASFWWLRLHPASTVARYLFLGVPAAALLLSAIVILPSPWRKGLAIWRDRIPTKA